MCVAMDQTDGWTALHSACLNGSCSRKELGKLRHMINSSTRLGNTPLHFACARPSGFKLAALLVQEGADILAPNDNDQTPLHVAAAHFTPSDVDSLLLLANPQRVDSKDENGCTPLHWAIQQSIAVIGTAVALLCAGANAEAGDASGDTPMHYAAREGNFRLFKLLVSGGANREKQNHRGLCPIHVACEIDDEDFVKEYVDHFEGDLPGTGKSSSTLLHVAARNGSKAVTELLLKQLPASAVDALDRYGQSPMVVAVANKNFEIATALEQAGAEVPANCKVVLELLKHGARLPSFGDSDDDTDSESDDDIMPLEAEAFALAT